MRNLRYWQTLPRYSSGQKQTLSAMHLPPFKQDGLQTAEAEEYIKFLSVIGRQSGTLLEFSCILDDTHFPFVQNNSNEVDPSTKAYPEIHVAVQCL